MHTPCTRRRLIQTTPFAAAAAIMTPALITPATTFAQSDAALVVDDAITTNPNLIAGDLQIPDGFDMAPATVNLPQGFTISLLAAGLDSPRFMANDTAGNLLVADQGTGAIYRYLAEDGGVAATPTPPEPLLSGLNAPSNVALFTVDGGDYLYVGETTQISRYAYDVTGAPGEQEIVIPDLPDGGHSTRTVAFGPDGMLYVAIGSSCNICVEDDDRRAAVMRYTPDGDEAERFAWGLRNPVGLAVQPGTDRLWATVNERDDQGDEIPPDLVTVVQQGANYGWPDCQPPAASPQETGVDCSGVTPPTVGIQAHSAPLGLAFYTGDAFPADLAGSLFVAQHGSWNRSDPAAPKLLRIAFDAGVPTAATDFATGWQDENGDRWGRPAGILVAPDGALIVSDDQAGVLYRIASET